MIVCHKPSISGLDRLEEAGTPAQELGVDPAAVVHTEMAGVEVAEDVVEDSDSPGPHRINRRIDRGPHHPRFVWRCDSAGCN